MKEHATQHKAVEPSKCLNCVLPICDQDRNLPCRFVLITVDEHLQKTRDDLRRQKREHNARVREMRRAEVEKLRKTVSRMLSEFGTFGKHTEFIKLVRQEKKQHVENH